MKVPSAVCQLAATVGLLLWLCDGAQAASGSALTVAFSASGAASSPANYSPALIAVELAKALAWPAAALLIAVAFRRSISDFFASIGGRVSKLSVFNVQIELNAATSATATPLLDEIKSAANPGEIADSSRALQEQVQSTEKADYAIISLGNGDQWITSRLFIAAAMMERMRGMKVFVFVGMEGSCERFLAVADIRQLRWLLAQKFPWLQLALVQAEAQTYINNDPHTTTDLNTINETGAVDPNRARRMVSIFIQSLQRPLTTPPLGGALQTQSAETEWVQLARGNEERATWVTPSLLYNLLPQKAFRAHMNQFIDEPRSRRTRAFLRRSTPFVALVDKDRRFAGLLNRQLYLENMAEKLGEEPEGSSS